MQRTDPAAVRFVTVERAGLRNRMLGIEMGEGLNLTLDRGDAVETARVYSSADAAPRAISAAASVAVSSNMSIAQLP